MKYAIETRLLEMEERYNKELLDECIKLRAEVTQLKEHNVTQHKSYMKDIAKKHAVIDELRVKMHQLKQEKTPQEKALQREREEVHDSVTEAAYTIFADCGRQEDFCVQHAGCACVTFGGWNRLILSTHGWHVSESHCTEEFVAKFRELYQ